MISDDRAWLAALTLADDYERQARHKRAVYEPPPPRSDYLFGRAYAATVRNARGDQLDRVLVVDEMSVANDTAVTRAVRSVTVPKVMG